MKCIFVRTFQILFLQRIKWVHLKSTSRLFGKWKFQDTNLNEHLYIDLSFIVYWACKSETEYVYIIIEISKFLCEINMNINFILKYAVLKSLLFLSLHYLFCWNYERLFSGFFDLTSLSSSRRNCEEVLFIFW